MIRDLERRLKAAETRQLASQRVATILRMIDAMSEQELLDQMAPSGMFDPRTMTDGELDCLIAEFKARAARPAGLQSANSAAGERNSPSSS
jgi:hypothetical protein